MEAGQDQTANDFVELGFIPQVMGARLHLLSREVT